jgi:hypothetical protein
MNKQLRDLYGNELNRLKKVEITNDDIDGTHLMYVWEEEYKNSKYKILFVGRETNGWMGYLNLDLDDCINHYKDFNLCKKGKYTTIWRYMYEVKNILMPESIGKSNFLWSNVSKFCKAESGKALDMYDFKLLHDNFKVLEEEIKITQPDVVIFFTGKLWDEKIQYVLSEEITFEKMHSEVSVDDLARVHGSNLPLKTYRVGHPQSMQLKKQWHIMEKVIEDIRKEK